MLIVKIKTLMWSKFLNQNFNKLWKSKLHRKHYKYSYKILIFICIINKYNKIVKHVFSILKLTSHVVLSYHTEMITWHTNILKYILLSFSDHSIDGSQKLHFIKYHQISKIQIIFACSSVVFLYYFKDVFFIFPLEQKILSCRHVF